MSLREERMQILKMLEEGKISAEEAAKLMLALGKRSKIGAGKLKPGLKGQTGSLAADPGDKRGRG